MKKMMLLMNAVLVWSSSVIMSIAYAQTPVTITGTASGQGASAINPLIGFLNNIAQFLTGPWAVFIVMAALVLAIGSWIWAPDNKAIGWLLRAVAGGILLLTMGSWLSGIGGAGGGTTTT